LWDIYECNRRHVNAVTRFLALRILSLCWLVGDHLLLKYFGPCGIFMNVTVVMLMLLRDFGPYVLYLYAGWLVIICCYEILGHMGYL
jgi:hypothetical protein